VAAREGLGDLHYFRGAYERALGHFDCAVSVAGAPAELARLYRKRGDLFEKQAKWQEAKSAYETGLDTMAADFNEGEAGLIYAGLSLVYYHLDELNTASELGDLALLIEERQGNRAGVARARCSLGVVLTRMKAWDKARHHFKLAQDQWDDLDDAYGMGSCCNNRGMLEMASENHDDARTLFQESLAHFSEISNKQGMARAHDNLSNLYVSIGDDERARKHMEEAARLLGSIVADSDELPPEIWRSGLW
jgi:tetratricopeptide (TPR) repeat protein